MKSFQPGPHQSFRSRIQFHIPHQFPVRRPDFVHPDPCVEKIPESKEIHNVGVLNIQSHQLKTENHVFDMTSNIANIEELRGPYESNVEWNLRRLFLEEHKDRFPEDRLVCLSNCFINVEMYGCRYPGPVMEQLKELSSSLPQDQLEKKTKVKGSHKIMFVKSSDSSTVSDTVCKDRPNTSRHDSDMCGGYPSLDAKYVSGGNYGFVKSDSEFRSVDIQSQNLKRKGSLDRWEAVSESNSKAMKVLPSKYKEILAGTRLEETITEKFQSLAKQIASMRYCKKNCIELIHEAVTKVKMTITCDFSECTGETGEIKFVCFMHIDFVQVAMGAGSNKKTAKRNAFTQALEMLSHTHFRVKDGGPDKKVLQGGFGSFDSDEDVESTSDDELDTLPELIETNVKNLGKKHFLSTQSMDFSEFIIMRPEMLTYTPSSLVILRQSCDNSKALLEIYMAGTTCKVKINGETMGIGVDEIKKIAKELAAEDALQKLQKVCWTIKIVKATDSVGPEMSKKDVLDGKLSSEAIPDSNIGHQLLKKMGWTGGGVGKEGREGIATPITVQQMVTREGLGRAAEKGVHVDMIAGLRQVVQNYAKSDNQDDLVFSLDFTDEERAIIHAEGVKCGLKTKSRGMKKANRYLTLSRKRSAKELLHYLKQCGGSTPKYELVPPQKQIH
ncbi:hypothetical protein ScPMuIL_010301 [Solemya velum]